MNITVPVNRFTAGEISPKLGALIDTELYNSSCRVLENFVVTNQGTLRRRNGSYYLGETNGGQSAIFHEFRSKSGDFFMLEVTPVFVRFWKEDGTLLRSQQGAIVSLAVPYIETELKELRIAVADNQIWIAHRNHRVRRITYDGNNFSIAIPTFTGGRTFDSAENYPGVICFYGGRLFLASTMREPSAIFASMAFDSANGTDRYTNFDFQASNPQPNSAIMLQEKDLLGTSLLWLVPQRRLIAATTKTTWLSDENPPMPETFDMHIQSYNGSADIQAHLADNILIYVGRDNISLRICAYSNEAGGLIDKNISKAAEHILRRGVVSMAVQTIPETVIWIALSDGTFASCLISFEDGIVAWSRHNMQNAFVESLNIMSREGGDDLYLCVKRDINGVTKRYVEVIHLSEIEVEKEDEHFIDCGKRITGNREAISIDGFDFLEGEKVSYLSDGAVKPSVIVSEGSIKVEDPFYVIHAGLPFSSKILFKKLELPANGTSQGKNKKIEKVVLRVYKTRGGKFGQKTDNLRELLYDRFGEITFGDTPDPYTGDVEIDFHGTTDKAPDLWVVADDPVGFHLLGAFIQVNVLER